jgi:hypothetical protein
MVTSVPYQLASSEAAAERADRQEMSNAELRRGGVRNPMPRESLRHPHSDRDPDRDS